MPLRGEAWGAIAAFVGTALFIVYPSPYLMALFAFVVQPLFAIVAAIYLRKVIRELRRRRVL